MIRIEQDAAKDATREPDATLTLPFELRQKSRLRARLDGGEEVALMLARGRVLRGGDRLLASDGRVIEVRAAAQTVSTVRSEDRDGEALVRGAYHLGNRHVPVEVGEGFLRYEHDHVLDEMVRGLGLTVVVEEAAFEPEGGAYAHGHGDGDAHAHVHAHEHAHEHERGHERPRLRMPGVKGFPR